MIDHDLVLSQLIDSLVAARLAATQLGFQVVGDAIDKAMDEVRLRERAIMLDSRRVKLPPQR